jgi:uncharacterized membrane protein YbaN (DUF454 family)
MKVSGGINKIVLMTLGALCVLLGFIGIFTPLLPTTPFILLAAFFFSKSSDRFHSWLLAHRLFGSMIENWRRNQSIPFKAKVFSISMLSVSGTFVAMTSVVSLTVKVIMAVVLVACAVFIATRPNSPV